MAGHFSPTQGVRRRSSDRPALSDVLKGSVRMRIGVPREVKEDEYRVAITPAGVDTLVRAGHRVAVERGAGEGSALDDADFAAAGADLVDVDTVWSEAEMVLKVKEPLPSEFPRLRDDLVLFTYLHLAASADATRALLDAGTVAIGYETVQAADGSLPLLAPMSEIAGRMASQVGAHCLEREAGGRGILLGGVAGVRAATVVVIGAGTAGVNAATVALGMGARVLLLDTDLAKLRQAEVRFGGRVQTLASNAYEVERACREADLVVGAVLVPGERAPRVVSDAVVAAMRPGAVLVDIAVDQGGCIEGSHPTTHSAPTFTVHDCVFYCVANMPGAVPHTSTHALTNATLPYVERLAALGWREAVRRDPALARGVNIADGLTVNAAVAHAHGVPAGKLADVGV